LSSSVTVGGFSANFVLANATGAHHPHMGEHIEGEDQGKWWRAKVLDSKDGKYFVTWYGCKRSTNPVFQFSEGLLKLCRGGQRHGERSEDRAGTALAETFGGMEEQRSQPSGVLSSAGLDPNRIFPVEARAGAAGCAHGGGSVGDADVRPGTGSRASAAG